MKRILISRSKDELAKHFIDKPIRIFNVNGFKFCLAKYKQAFFAFETQCPHQKHQMAEAEVTAFGEVVCPLHFYRFSLRHGQEANRLCHDLETYPIELSEEGIFVILPL